MSVISSSDYSEVNTESPVLSLNVTDKKFDFDLLNYIKTKIQRMKNSIEQFEKKIKVIEESLVNEEDN